MEAVACSKDELELGDFEYLKWSGTPKQYADEMPAFLEYVQPLHESAEWYWATFFGVPHPSDMDMDKAVNNVLKQEV